VRNKARSTAIKTAEKKFKASLEAGDVEASKAALKNVFAKLDKGVKNGIIHKNKSSRKKSRLAALLNKKD
jgi:small subunit ribosomal protein S20